MSEPIVETRYGLVRGVIEKSSEGFDYCAFKGIPYAKPPVGELRFKDPVPLEKWTGVKDATKYGPICAQYEAVLKVRGESEDCLHLNVYAKNAVDQNAKKAVMVWIHGGGFCFGFANDYMYGPDYLLRKDIILVTANYRLGVFGFLDLEDEVAPGNQGLKDQVMALRWVQENIKNFGGDPGNVTIFGESAGGASVHYLTLSPLTKGLFHRAIAQSGVVFNPWASQHNPRKTGQELCSMLGKDLKDSKDIVEYLRTIDCKKLHEAQEKLAETKGKLAFGPGVDAHSPNPFLPVPLDEIAHEGAHVPYLIGYNSREGILFLLDLFSFSESNEEVIQKIDENFELILQYRSKKVLEYYNLTVKQFKRLYYKSEHFSANNRDKFADLASDLYFVEGVHKFVKIQAEKSSCPTYLYRLTYDPGNSLIKSQIKSCIPGTCHFDDVGYLFKMRAYDDMGLEHLKKDTQCYKIMEQMTEMWTNFAKYGKPTIETSDLTPVHWLPVNDGTVLRYMNIDEDITMQSTLNIEKKYSAASAIRT